MNHRFALLAAFLLTGLLHSQAELPHTVFAVGGDEDRGEPLADFQDVTRPDDESHEQAPWLRMDYGPFVSTAVDVGGGLPPVHKGLVVRLRTRAGEDTDLHAVFDTDLLAWRCAWEGELELSGIVYDGPHGTFPAIVGEPLFRMEAVPGLVVEGLDSGDATDPREEPWGPVPDSVGRWTGVHIGGGDLVFEYTSGGGRHRLLERVWAEHSEDGLAFVREVTVTTEGGAAGPRLRVHGAASVVELPPNGTTLLSVHGSGTARSSGPAHPRGVREALQDARPRWGAPLVTRGVVDDPLDDEAAARRVEVPAGSDARTVRLLAEDGQPLQLLEQQGPVAATTVDRGLVLRYVGGPPGAALPSVLESGGRLGWWPADAGSGTHEVNALTGEADLRLDGVTWRRGLVGRSLDFDGTAAAWLDDCELVLAEQDVTIAAWIQTTRDGTVFAVAPAEDGWVSDGVTLFLREGRLTFDVGWVGAVGGGPRIDDGAWHHVAATWRHAGGGVRLFVDGERVAAGRLPLNEEDEREEFVPRFGWTSEDFPETSRFSGYMDGLLLLDRAVDDGLVLALATHTGEPLVEATIVGWNGDADIAPTLRIMGTSGTTELLLDIPATGSGAAYEVHQRRGPLSAMLAWRAGWRGASATVRPFRIDRLTWPDDNPHGSWLRFGAFDFARTADGVLESAWITTWSGDLWRVDGLDEDLDELVWTRVATGLNQPFGIVDRSAVAGDDVLVLGRDQITRVHDRNGDGEADFLESFTSAVRNSEHFHEPASGLTVAPDGSLFYVKAARHAKHALHDHHGTLLRLSPDGRRTEVVARGFRAPIGLGALADGTWIASDQEGHWMPANRINLIRPSADAPRFYGNGWAARSTPGERIRRGGERVQPAWSDDAAWEPPLCWLHPSVDRSPSAQLQVDHPAWGPLDGAILGLSYGTGEVYLVLRDDVAQDGDVVSQGGVVKLGIQLPTGLLAGRVHPDTGDLYVCGLFGWSSDRAEAGGFYRVRPMTSAWEASLNVPRAMRATERGLELTFLRPLDRASATRPSSWSATAWNYRRTADYGSATYALDGRRDSRTTLAVTTVELAEDGRTVRLAIDDFAPCMQLHVDWAVQDAAGLWLEHEAHLTVNALHDG